MFRILQSNAVGLFTIKGWNRIAAIPFPGDNLFKRSHTDIKVPNFDKYRRKSVIKPDIKTRESEEERKLFTSLLVGVTTLATCYSVKSLVHFFVKSMAMSADVQALAQIEVELNDINEGGHSTLKWRGKPLFLKHRSPEEIKACRETDVSTLRDPETDEERCPKPEWLIVIGVCTHLGCIPIPNSGDYLGGYYCPCHGSHYDAAGRIRKGPAPTNMEIPEHVFKTENLLVVG
ncbi:hypothetical protein WA026_011269 [Henosepilachna vigintioctopunctata]|uniref:Cytochrome b-c1 complex subunit Rieske, mitochondrial n=1 Tax=Henosepilachna vigintioctopunctata TaxID=420089 RepID=A0AAW1U642_9CUCU